MSEIQKNIIESFLRDKGKKKRDLSKILGINENSLNRTLRNPGIKLSILREIATFLEVELVSLLPDSANVSASPSEEYHRLNPLDASNRITFQHLSEALNRSTKTVENLVKIIANHFPEKGE